MQLVVIESPFAPSAEYMCSSNIQYARDCMRDCLLKGEAPYASHLLYTQSGVLEDNIPHERALGMTAGFFWAEKAPKRVFYIDHGISRGMRAGLVEARRLGQQVEIRSLYRPIDLEKDYKELYGEEDS